jgi:hypothetical protein
MGKEPKIPEGKQMHTANSIKEKIFNGIAIADINIK